MTKIVHPEKNIILNQMEQMKITVKLHSAKAKSFIDEKVCKLLKLIYNNGYCSSTIRIGYR